MELQYNFSTAPISVKSRKNPKVSYILQSELQIFAARTAILALTLSSGRNKTHGKGTKLAETGRYLARHGD